MDSIRAFFLNLSLEQANTLILEFTIQRKRCHRVYSFTAQRFGVVILRPPHE